MERRETVVAGTPVAWYEAGEGPAVVLVHGIPTSPQLWRHVVPRLAGMRCLAFEMVGYGSSIPAGKGQDISVARQAEVLLGWLGELDVGQAILAGHDLGGGVVQIAAVRRPEVCAGLVLTNSIGYDSWPIPSVRALRATAGLVERLPDVVLRGLFASLIRRGHDDARRARESLDLHWTPYVRHGAGAALAEQVRWLDVRDTVEASPRLAELVVPARVVWGVDDGFQTLGYGERLARDLRAPLQRIEGGRHFTPEDHPDEVARAIRDLVPAMVR